MRISWSISNNPVTLISLMQRLFVVPASPKQKEIPYARVNHNKYMVTDKIAYIGTLHTHARLISDGNNNSHI